jgi:sugar transferase EpsL
MPFNRRWPRLLHMAEYRAKRLVDLILVIGSTPVWVPLLVAVAALVRLRLGSPVLFRQQRTGAGERSFWMLKFRSMTSGTDGQGAPLPDALRLTPFGKSLRSASLDELPELLNVLRGEMSLVGPRPLLPKYLDRYSRSHRRRHAVRPGLTGLAQVSGRNAIGWAAKFDLDVTYVDHCSLSLDVVILWRTLRSVLLRDGIAADGDATMPEFIGYDEPTVRSATPP